MFVWCFLISCCLFAWLGLVVFCVACLFCLAYMVCGCWLLSLCFVVARLVLLGGVWRCWLLVGEAHGLHMRNRTPLQFRFGFVHMHRNKLGAATALVRALYKYLLGGYLFVACCRLSFA